MQCYTELIPPTAVTSCVSLPFISPSANNLVLAKTSLLQIFALKSVAPIHREDNQVSQSGQPERSLRRDRANVTKLVLASEHHVAGTITSLARISKLRSKSGGDLLLVALKDAKLSLIGWDPERYTVSTISIHYYEREDLLGPAWGPPLGRCQSHLSVDPSNRCAAFRFGGRQIAVLPLTQGMGDDLVIDDHEAELDTTLKRRRSSTNVNGETTDSSPTFTSFILSLLSLDPALTHPISLAFLHEYREPTLGVVSSQVATSSALLASRKDCVAYTVYTLDLEQRASTTLLSVQCLPYDVHKVIPLPLPIGGAILLGVNEVIHVDQSGKTNGVGVNEFARRCSAFPMVVQAELNLKLDDCVVETLGTSSGDLLLYIGTGELVILRFQVEGRSVSGLVLEKVPMANGGHLVQGRVSCSTSVGRGRLFVGCEQADSIVLGWSLKTPIGKRKQADSSEEGIENDLSVSSDADSLDDDDLYGDAEPDQTKGRADSLVHLELKADECLFRVHDKLLNISPLASLSTIALQGRPNANSAFSDVSSSGSSLLAIAGENYAAKLIRLTPNVPLNAVRNFKIAPASRLWSLQVDAAESDSTTGQDNGFHKVLVTSTSTDSENAGSQVYTLKENGLQILEDSDFDPEAGSSVEVFTILDGSRVIQILPAEVRVFEADFSLAQIVPLSDESAPSNEIIAVNVAEPFILLLRRDHSLTLLRAGEAGELEEVEDTGVLPNTRWKSGSLFDDVDDVFRMPFDTTPEDVATSVLMFLLDIRGGLQIFRLPGLGQPVYSAPGLSFLPSFLTQDFSVRRSNAREPLEEILIAELGDATHKAPFMVLRASTNDLAIYAPYHDSTEPSSKASLRFTKLPCRFIAEAPQEAFADDAEIQVKERLSAVSNFHGLSIVMLTGSLSCFVMKTAATNPQVLPLRKHNVLDLSSFHSSECPNGVASLASSACVTVSSLPDNIDVVASWAIQSLFGRVGLSGFAYHEVSRRLILSKKTQAPFKLPSDETHPEWNEEDIHLFPHGERDTIELMEPSTWTVTDTFSFGDDEVVLGIKVISLEISEHTRKAKDMAVVGTGILRGEDVTAQGVIYVFDILDVVPEPDQPETGYKLKLLSKVMEKGAVTALTHIGSEGFVLAAQGQKCLVRGLKEDHSLQPVAFLDVQGYTTVVKELRGTGFCIIGDAAKGLWLAGYTEEPYSLRCFGKAMNHTAVVAAEFLPDGRTLQILMADLDGSIHVLQFDPQNPKSLSGQRILHLSNFSTGAGIASMELLPRMPTSWERLREATEMDTETLETASPHQVLVASSTGALALLTPLSASQYRSLASLQAWLGTTALTHPLSLGPRGRRNVDADLSVGGRTILDGDVLSRWNELGSWKRAEGVTRAGADAEWEVRAMLETVSGRGLGFL